VTAPTLVRRTASLAAAALVAALLAALCAGASWGAAARPNGVSWDSRKATAALPTKRVKPGRLVRGQRTNNRLHGKSTGGTTSGSGGSSGTSTPITNYAGNATDMGSLYNTTLITGARDYWRAGYTGKGIDVAVIDTGVAPVEGVNVSGKIFHGADLSFESQAGNLRYLDTYGHGTHMAGIIAGRGPKAIAGQYVNDQANFLGMAPDARILSIKVAESNGATDVSQVIAAIDWVVQHRKDNGLNVRVLCLAYGTDSDQSYLTDPLAYAVEEAWKAGIVVVAAAGNAGFAKQGSLTNPAYDPFIIAVGATDPKGTVLKSDDVVASFSSSSLTGMGGSGGTRLVDVVAPGKSVVSLRVPNSYLDANYASTGSVNPGLFRGSGTSQAAAVVAGAAALVLQQRPTLTPAQVKRLLRDSATRLSTAATTEQGAGELNLTTALNTPSGSAPENNEPSNGTGSLELARGSVHLSNNGVSLQGEQDIFGKVFDSPLMAALEATASSWSGGVWNGSTWTGSSWSGSSWSASSWSGSSWSGSSWSSANFSSSSWSSSSWSSSSWSASSWSASSWSSSSWSSSSWS
jgi:serine protease AprX